ncbi:MAG: tRNA uridine-5-carboxymethylaminomethyl(34) synthesis GTPase MnmE [Candidatus Sumerlaeaceae bacterium]|nr:tRNA uridine-5-carboxymethylaminomethyl(34) synthesis GTPase MnmE [Candidatus Sumerlaeaceae bacterium]
MTDTIAAPATAAGQAAIAIVRLSGPQAHAVFFRLFRPRRPQDRPPRPMQLLRGTVISATGEPLDDALGTIMRAPHSYTGEDMAEFQVHGSPAVVAELLDACLRAGARLAAPGEFTRRAVLNGRMDLARAEAVADLIAAQTAASRRAALRQLDGDLSAAIETVRSRLLDLAAHIEANLDFPEEEIPATDSARWLEVVCAARNDCLHLLDSYKRGRWARSGVRVVIAGAPNAGKSSLFNALVGRERAIVTPHPGTTRDTIESTVDMAGIAVTLVDTAGLREDADMIEQLGIQRTAEALATADMILHVIDSSSSLPPMPLPVIPEGIPVIRVMNKCDLPHDTPPANCKADMNTVFTSTVTRSGLGNLEKLVSNHFACEPEPGEVVVTSARHAACLEAAINSLGHATEALAAGLSGDLVMVDLRGALRSLGEITGNGASEEILDRVFSNFCIGK